MRAPLTFVGEKYRKVTAVYPATDNQSCTCKLNLGIKVREFGAQKLAMEWMEEHGKE